MAKLASLKLTAAALLLLLLSVQLAQVMLWRYDLAIIPAVSLLMVNLIAAIFSNTAFKKSLSLLIFHLALAAMLPVALLGQLSGLSGRVEVPEGGQFTGRLDQYDGGFLHDNQLEQLNFTLLAVNALHIPGKRAQELRARILIDNGENQYQQVVAEHRPLVFGGYRFYVTKNIGFAANFTWLPKQGNAEFFSINFPWFAGNELSQANTMTLGDLGLWFKLEGTDDVLDPMTTSRFIPPRNHYLVVRNGAKRDQLKPGQQLQLKEGLLIYNGLHSWQGFKVEYDTTKAWVLACAFLACFAMAAYYWQRFSQRPWQRRVKAKRKIKA